MSNPLIKICGVQDPEVAKQAAKSGAQFVGLVFHPGSKRHVDIEQAKEIAQAVKSENAFPVAIFVDQLASEMQDILTATQIECMQLHGSNARRQHHLLSEQYQRIYVQTVCSNGVINPDSDEGLSHCDPHRDFLLFDGIHAGTGQSFSWNNFHYDGDFRFGLAGGLDASNVAKAIKMIKPTLLDVSSGVEDKMGRKDVGLIRAFIRFCRVDYDEKHV